MAEATWLVLNVPSPSGAAVQAAGVTKIARSVIAPLAEHHVSVLMLSTYQTDFILVSFPLVLAGGLGGGGVQAGWAPWVLGDPCVVPLLAQVREQDLSVVIHTLAREFDIYREVGGEPVPVARDDSSNGFPRAQHGETRPLTPGPRRGLPFPPGALPLCRWGCGFGETS